MSADPSSKNASANRRWPLQDAKARFSELVRKARSEGPQHVTIHGRDAVVVLSDEDYLRLMDKRSGAVLVKLLADSPLRDVAFDRVKVRGSVRGVEL